MATTIKKSDLILLLSEIEENGIDTKEQLRELVSSKTLPINVIKFINDHRPLELTQFYDKLRKSYNDKRSKLYVSILKFDKDAEQNYMDVLTTLSSYQLQAFLFAEKLYDAQMFIRHSRVGEVTRAINKYIEESDIATCLKLLEYIQLDLKACEIISGRREDN